jgi:hypothetical protein
MTMTKVLEHIAGMTDIDDLDRIFRAVCARQSELWTEDEMTEIWQQRIGRLHAV